MPEVAQIMGVTRQTLSTKRPELGEPLALRIGTARDHKPRIRQSPPVGHVVTPQTPQKSSNTMGSSAEMRA